MAYTGDVERWRVGRRAGECTGMKGIRLGSIKKQRVVVVGGLLLR